MDPTKNNKREGTPLVFSVYSVSVGKKPSYIGHSHYVLSVPGSSYGESKSDTISSKTIQNSFPHLNKGLMLKPVSWQIPLLGTQLFCFTSGWNARALTHLKNIQYSSITKAKHLADERKVKTNNKFTEGDKLGSLLYNTGCNLWRWEQNATPSSHKQELTENQTPCPSSFHVKYLINTEIMKRYKLWHVTFHDFFLWHKIFNIPMACSCLTLKLSQWSNDNLL